MFQNIDNGEFERICKQKNVVVMDVRTPKEVSEGFIPGTSLFLDINNSEEFSEEIKKLDRAKAYVVYCRSGARSAKACKILEQQGFKGPFYNLALGYKGWEEKNK